MCRTSKDIRVEYKDRDELKKLRQAYIMHIMDYVCQDRDRVFKNDMKALEERNEGRVTLQNVFEIADAQEKAKEEGDENNDLQDEDYGEEGEDELSEDEDIESIDINQEGNTFLKQPNDSIKKADGCINIDDEEALTKDQGFTRPKALILAPFKHMAYQIIEMLILLANDGKWKKVFRRKKFRQDFGNEEEAFDDHFKIGISIKHMKKS